LVRYAFVRAVAKSEELVAAEAVLVPLDDINIGISRENIKGLSADKETVKKAAKILEGLGFSILAEGVVSITILGTKNLFENVFQIKLKLRKQNKPATTTNTTNLKLSYFVPDRKVNVPKELENLVFNVVFEKEPAYM
jgi:hypothetical protein